MKRDLDDWVMLLAAASLPVCLVLLSVALAVALVISAGHGK